MLIHKVFIGCLLFCAVCAPAQVSPLLTPTRTGAGSLVHRPAAPRQVPGPSRVDEFIVDGKLRLTPRSTVDRYTPKLASAGPKPWDRKQRDDDPEPSPAA